MSETSAGLSVEQFIARWRGSGASERSNYAVFFTELCDLIGVPHPDPAGDDTALHAYVVDRYVEATNSDGTKEKGYIDLYKRGCFVLEAKQGSDAPADGAAKTLGTKPAKRRKGTAKRDTGAWDMAMDSARNQALRYVRALPAEEGNPPFVITTDIGYSFDLFSDFSRAGKNYIPFPDARSNRIMLADLEKPEIREMLRALWLDPMALDPSRRSAAVTRDVAGRLAALARSLEGSGHAPGDTALFLMRTIFTMFAEDVGLLPERGFLELLESLRGGELANFPPMVESLWGTMAEGGFSPIIRKKLLRFNGGLFERPTALLLTGTQLDLLIDAAKSDWRHVEPAIFGTLLERALDPRERHKLGAHFTPRAYVERLVMPAVIEPLREEWEATMAAAAASLNTGKRSDAVDELRAFHRKLCSVRVLDPACGTGNFLYVTMEHMKRLEGEVLRKLEELGETDRALELSEMTVDPHQLLGIEINPRAAAIADLVIWIGYLQWHFRTHGDALPREPVLRKFNNIEHRDALLDYDSRETVLDAEGRPVTRWDGHTTKRHPVTGEEVPDETAREPLYMYINSRRAEWPAAEYVVGNPPFIGPAMMRAALGDGYTEALRRVYREIPDSVDFVMYWWHRAAELLRDGGIERFGFIATNSLRQTFNRRVVAPFLEGERPVSIVFAIPDHPWVDSVDGAAVRISMTVAEAGERAGTLSTVVSEVVADDFASEVELDSRHGIIHADLTVGADLDTVLPLKANSMFSSRGMQLIGAGFIVTPEEAHGLGLGQVPGLENVIRDYRNGRDLTGMPRNVLVIDLFGHSAEQVRSRYPDIYQWVHDRVRPEREAKAGRTKDADAYAKTWWQFGKSRPELRRALAGLDRYIATVETSKHRFFVFLDKSILPDNMLVNFALDDAYALGVLSSRVHVTWALAAGGRLGVGNDPRYNKTRCFEPFPFPDPTPEQRQRIRDLGEQLDAHRKRRQAEHPGLTITDIYNVLEKLRAGEPLSEKEKRTHEAGLVSVLKEIHDELDRAVAEAYGWPPTLTDEEILERLVALNAEHAREEAAGLVRWLRPEFQSPQASAGTQEALAGLTSEPKTPAVPTMKTRPATAERVPWPKTLKEQAQAVRAAVAALATPASAEQIAAGFKSARKDRVAELLEALAELGQVRETDEGTFTA